MEKLVAKLQELSGYRSRPLYSDGVCPFELVTTASLRSEEAPAISAHDLPSDVRLLWEKFDKIRLFEDAKYGQWGLLLLNEAESTAATEELAKTRSKDFVAGDLVIAKFLGDSDLLIVRTDPEDDDFGTVMVALPLDDRSEWYRLGESLSEFMNAYIDAEGEKYWERTC